MSNIETLEKLLSFAFVMSENMVGLSKGNYDEATFVKKTYEYLHKYIGNFECRDILKSALQRLEAIDNAKPSEALEELFKTSYFCSKEEYDKINSCYDSIKQALIKAQEQEKVLSIVFEKNVDVLELRILIKHHNDRMVLKLYNRQYKKEWQLTQEEFNLLKEYFKYER